MQSRMEITPEQLAATQKTVEIVNAVTANGGIHPKAPKFLKRHLFKSNVPAGSSGRFEVRKVSISRGDAMVHNIRCALNYHRPSSKGRELIPGDYTKLLWFDDNYSEVCVMSDTPAELRDFDRVYREAHGNVLIAGLGLGVTTELLAKKKNISSILVIEKSLDVIKLVAPHMSEKITVVHGDLFRFGIKKYMRANNVLAFSFAWFDIWNHISGDNVKEMNRLRKKYSDVVLGPILQWCEGDCRKFWQYHLKERLEAA